MAKLRVGTENGAPIEIYYEDKGAGQPVVLIHGWPLSGRSWEMQVPALIEAGYRVITYDRRGFGWSSQPWSGYDYGTFAADLHALMEHLDLRNATLVGFSMGGGEVARYIGRHGTARVRSAALIAAVTPFLLQTEDNPEGVDQSAFDEITDGLRKDRPHFLAGFARKFFGAGLLNFDISSELLDWTGQVAMLASPKATLDCVRAFAATDFRDDLRKMDLPTLVIHGDEDQTVPIDVSARRAVELLPQAELKVYEGEPHGLFFTAKERLNRDLAAFAGS